MISGNMVGAYSQLGKTFIITDADGNELTGVVTENVQAFDATPADVRINKKFVSDNGIEIGENTITYRTTCGYQAILPGQAFSIPLSMFDGYNYTQLQCMIAPLNTSFDDSYAVNKVVINDGVYHVQSTDKISSVTKNIDTTSIDLNIVNNDSKVNFIYYFTYKEER